MMGFMSFQEETPESLFPVLFPAIWAHSDKAQSTRWEDSSHQNPTMQAPWSWISSLQNCETITFCCLSYPVCGTFDSTLSWLRGEGNGTTLQYSCLENLMDGEACRLQSMGLLRIGHDWATSLSLFTFMHWRRKWQPTPVFWPRESQGWGSLVGCCIWGCRVGHKWSNLAAAAASWLRQKISN